MPIQGETRTIHGVSVHGVDLGSKTECGHWHSELDVIAIRFPCCNEFYACHDCHLELADHPPQRWPVQRFDDKMVLCGACGTQLTAKEYFESKNSCPNCAAHFNPGCQLHRHLYFEVNEHN